MIFYPTNTPASPVTWTETTEEKYWEMLEILPPAVMTGLGFLVGEPMDHDACPVTGNFGPRFTAYAKINNLYFVADQAMSIQGFKRLNPSNVKG